MRSVEQETRDLDKVREILQALDIVQNVAVGVFTQGERRLAEGRKCVLCVTGMQYHPDEAFYFLVSNGRIQQVPSMSQYDTYLKAPLTTTLQVLERVWQGDEGAFVDARAKYGADVRGDHHLHDLLAIGQAFARVAKFLKNYRATAR